ncbi:hypothetical protein LCGC14_2480930, partial [marine sediment metagenome]
MNFLHEENVSISIKDEIHDLGFDVCTLHDFNMLGIQNGKQIISQLIFPKCL